MENLFNTPLTLNPHNDREECLVTAVTFDMLCLFNGDYEQHGVDYCYAVDTINSSLNCLFYLKIIDNPISICYRGYNNNCLYCDGKFYGINL